MVLFNNDSTEEGLGRVIVNIFDKNGNKAARIITESDGYVNHLGLLPGDYYAEIDSVQMQRLQMIASPAKIDFKIKALLEGDVFTALDFVLRKRHIDKLGLISQDSIKDRLALDSAGMQKKTLLDDKTENIDLLLAKVTQKILFAVGKFAINPIYKQYFLQVVQLMKNYPEIELLLEGLCDNDGSQEFNQKLSVKRATAVRNELIKLGADGKRIEVVGLGSLKPLNSNANAIEKSINRRVEFKLNTKKKTNSENVINKNEIDNLGTNDTAKTIKIAVVKDTNLKVNITKPTDIKKPKDSQIPVDLKNFMDNTCNQPGSYYIQCGVFKNKKAALQLANKLKGNTEIYVGIEVINSLYKVQLGCFTDKAAADKLMQELITKKVCGSMFIGIRK